MRLPKSPTGPQRVHLHVATLAELQHTRWYYAPRYTWDDRVAAPSPSPEILALLAAGDYREAWLRCGITLDFDDLSCLQSPSVSPTSPLGVAELAAEAAAAFGVDQVATLFGAYLTIDVPSMTASAADPGNYLEVPVRIPTSSVRPELPLPPPCEQRSPGFRVRCHGQWHRLGIVGGRLTLHDHDELEQRREAALRALGGDSPGCFGVEQAWLQGGGRLPRELHEYRRRLMHRLQFGDTEHLLRGLRDGTIDPRMRANNGWSLLHMAVWLDHARVVPALLEAGVPVDGADRIGRTPLYEAVMQGGDIAFIRALLAAGANPRAETVHGATPRHAARYYHDGRDLAFLADIP
ncbi:ankyrin repeat domain-containing protein [Dactylosporangium sp. CS-033363]|uniref:ankyrin repeat domain-containing protein n=1 Tax=Dactylosporangium sp. CS-033363 TaxID=3239935 RepID=UPI003D928287